MWTVIGLAIALCGPPLFAVVTSAAEAVTSSLAVQFALQLLYVAMAGLVIWIVVQRERRPLASIGLKKPGPATVAVGLLLAAFTVFVLPVVTDPLVNASGANVQPGIDRLASLPGWFRVALAATGGPIEELLYRGYAIERLITLTGRRWMAGAVSTIAFALAHVPAWGIGFALAADLPFGIVMTVVYLWRRELAANAIAHGTGLVAAMMAIAP
jgi:membrane protease YdiL (CAAX protease family)